VFRGGNPPVGGWRELFAARISAMSVNLFQGPVMRMWYRIKWWLLFITIVWLLLASVLLIDHAKNYSHAMISDRIWRTLSHIVLLKWITKYQTLIAGISALAGASFVYLTAKYSASESKKLENTKRKAESVSACAIVAQDFHDAAYQIIYYAKDDKLPLFQNTTAYLFSIAKINTMLSSVVASIKLDTTLFIDRDSQNASIKRHHKIGLQCYMVWQILMHVSDNIAPDGTYDLRNEGNIPVGELNIRRRMLLAKPEDIIGLYGFFDWSSDQS